MLIQVNMRCWAAKLGESREAARLWQERCVRRRWLERFFRGGAERDRPTTSRVWPGGSP